MGDELLAGAHPDLNSPFLARALQEHGLEVKQVAVVGDDVEAIAEAVLGLAQTNGVVLVSGGLGPTDDDLTRHGVARAAGRSLVTSNEALAQVSAWYAQLERPMPPSNARQALVPEGAQVLFNPTGTAPGFEVAVADARVIVLPGPPSELQVMWADVVGPLLLKSHAPRGHRQVHMLHLQGLSESVFSDQCGDWVERGQNPTVGVTVAGGILSIRCVARGATEKQTAEILDGRLVQLRERFGMWVFSEQSADPAEVLVQLLMDQGLKVTCAESCTGGLLSAALTAIPGASSVLGASVTTYSNGAKQKLLGVHENLIDEYGAVSQEVVGAMAQGAADRAGADLGLATSGIAGPGGGSAEKPVGLVMFGVFYRGHLWTGQKSWSPQAGRASIRAWATSHALVCGIRALEGRL